jgi:hypothetical protein
MGAGTINAWLAGAEARESAAQELSMLVFVAFAGGGAIQVDIRRLPGPDDGQPAQVAVRDVLRASSRVGVYGCTNRCSTSPSASAMPHLA